MSQEKPGVISPQGSDGIDDGAVDWNDEATRLLRSVLVRNGVSTTDLMNSLSKIGVEETRKGLEAKLRRGSFSVAFLLQCMNALGINEVSPMLTRRPKH